MENNETLTKQLGAALVDRVQERLFDVLNDAIGDELVELMNDTDWVSELDADEQQDLMYEVFSRVVLSFH